MQTAEAMGHVGMVTAAGICPLLFGSWGVLVGFLLAVGWIIYCKPKI